MGGERRNARVSAPGEATPQSSPNPSSETGGAKRPHSRLGLLFQEADDVRAFHILAASIPRLIQYESGMNPGS